MIPDGIIFDLDGTMWDTTAAAAEIWSKIVSEYDDVTTKITAEKLKGLYGLPLHEIGYKLFPELSHARSEEIVDRCVVEQCPYLERNGAILIGEVEKTLKELSKYIKLFIVSNCEDGYIQAFLHSHDFEKYITDFSCPGMTGLLKADNTKNMVKKYNLFNPVYVGDTLGDLTASREANVPFVFASYGFGEVPEYDYKLNTISDLLTLFPNKTTDADNTQMERITSFCVDHTKLLPGIYVSRIDHSGECAVTTFDIRLTRPNLEPVLNTAEIHTLEHLGATFLRNHPKWASKIVYFGPMGCRTGFYLLVFGEYTSKEISKLVTEMFEFARDYEGKIPGDSEVECGNHLDLNLKTSRYVAKKYLENVLYKLDDEHLVYPNC